MRISCYILFLISFSGISQDTSSVSIDPLPVQNLIGIEVIRAVAIRMQTPRYSILSKKDIEEMQANDVGDILQKLEGVNLKSYGGLGGLKTISVRSLGSQHSAITIDGFSVQNSQTGQINLAQIQTNNLESIALGVGEEIGYLNPVSSRISGNNVSLQTFEMLPIGSQDSLQIRASARIGSFGQINGYGAVKAKIKKGFVSGFGNYRLSNGEYPYKIFNGNDTLTNNRTNNDYQDQYFGGVAGYDFKRDLRARVSYRGSKIDQGLPGAVILYNNSADERLTTGDHTATADLRFRISEGMYARAYANANSNAMRYFDPTYFNAAGEVDVTYLNRNLNAGVVAQGYRVKDGNYLSKRTYFFGLEGGMSDLRSSDSLFSNPVRQQLMGIAGARFDFGYVKLRGHVSGQFVREENLSAAEGKDIIAVNPYVSLETKESERYSYMRHRIWYRNSLRVPSFNELYYNNIGNNLLDPERANQFGYNLSLVPVDRYGKRIVFRLAGYFNRITDKIVAIPTQNLFTWSIQNVGIVHAYGGEATVDGRWPFGRENRMILSSSINYSFQRSLDMSDPDHPTYGHQIAYIPMHTGNFDLAFEYKNLGGKVSNYLISKRYSLNENNLANELAGFVTTDVSVFYKINIKKKQSIRIQFQAKNVFNKSYAYIRSFVMPGRNYLISINYAFN